jgi:hypothetical protein
LTHRASPAFWARFQTLPTQVQELARKNFELLKRDPRHLALHFKSVGRYRSARVGLQYRALGTETEDGVLWFWIGTHAEYDRILR